LARTGCCAGRGSCLPGIRTGIASQRRRHSRRAQNQQRLPGRIRLPVPEQEIQRIHEARIRRTAHDPAGRKRAGGRLAPQGDSGPSGEVKENTATFTYSAVPKVGGETFECSLDSGAFASCPSSGITYTGLAGGQHTFAVRSVTASGNRDVSPATRTWTYLAVP